MARHRISFFCEHSTTPVPVIGRVSRKKLDADGKSMVLTGRAGWQEVVEILINVK
jgi:hypothetical protein